MSRVVRFLDRGWLVLAAGLTSAAALAALWLLRAPVPFTPDPEPVPLGETVNLERVSYTLRAVTLLDAVPTYDGTESPMAGASFVAVRFDYESRDGSDVSCLTHLLGDDRRWSTPKTISAKDWGYRSFCEGTSGTVMEVFEIPSTAVEEIHGIRIFGNGAEVILAGKVEAQ